MLTTKILSLDKEIADPKPVTGFDYAGQPMRGHNAHYNGRPEHMQPGSSQRASDSVSNHISTQPEQSNDSPMRRSKRVKRVISPERRAALAQRMRDYWRTRKANQAQTP